MNTIQKFEFDNQLIEFKVINGNVMVNATQMANIFGKEVTFFLRNDDTNSFINSCLKTENSQYINVKSREDLVQGKQKSGTWMHRILSLKFAAWLNPDFELWVYATIDRILFDYYKRLEESLQLSAKREKQIAELEAKLNDLPEFQTLERLKFEERQEKNKRAKENRNQLEMFKETAE